tara:strand:- start:1126 stop:1242 length:117 start_codon:yes stop_codon:yes gene_type:complete
MKLILKLFLATLIAVLLYFVIDAKYKHMTSQWTLDEQK